MKQSRKRSRRRTNRNYSKKNHKRSRYSHKKYSKKLHKRSNKRSKKKSKSMKGGGTLKEEVLEKIFASVLTTIKKKLPLFAQLRKGDIMRLKKLQDEVDEGEDLMEARFETLTECAQRPYSSRDEESESQEQEEEQEEEDIRKPKEGGLDDLAILKEKLGKMLSQRWTMSWATKMLFKHQGDLKKILSAEHFKKLMKNLRSPKGKLKGNQSGGATQALLICIAVLMFLLLFGIIGKVTYDEVTEPDGNLRFLWDRNAQRNTEKSVAPNSIVGI